MDSQLRTPPTAKLFDVKREVIIYCAPLDPTRAAALEARGAKLVPLPTANRQVDLQAMLKDLARHEINELHVEAGGTLNGALIEAGLVDECLLYMAPKILGNAQTAFEGMTLTQLANAPEMNFKEVKQIGPDLRVRTIRTDKDAF